VIKKDAFFGVDSAQMPKKKKTIDFFEKKIIIILWCVSTFAHNKDKKEGF
jgi:hypothetical protein